MAAFAFRPIGELMFLGRRYSSGMGTLYGGTFDSDPAPITCCLSVESDVARP